MTLSLRPRAPRVVLSRSSKNHGCSSIRKSCLRQNSPEIHLSRRPAVGKDIMCQHPADRIQIDVRLIPLGGDESHAGPVSRQANILEGGAIVQARVSNKDHPFYSGKLGSFIQSNDWHSAASTQSRGHIPGWFCAVFPWQKYQLAP